MAGLLKNRRVALNRATRLLKKYSPIWKDDMRDLLFKNLTSQDKRKRIIASSEIVDNAGVRSIVRRHFICLVREIKPERPKGEINKIAPCVYILRQENTKEQKKKFICRIKGSVYAVNNGKLFLILFIHSLKINLISLKTGFKQGSD